MTSLTTNIIVLVDKSSSMSQEDMPGKTSRWSYLEGYAKGLVNAASSFAPAGIALAFFNGSYQSKLGVTAENFAALWSNQIPLGGTALLAPLEWAFGLHFEGKSSQVCSSTLVLIFTDGEPRDKHDIAKAIIETSNKIDEEKELTILFIQVGFERDATAFLQSLDNDLQQVGAKFDIVTRLTTDDIDRLQPQELLMAAVNRTL